MNDNKMENGCLIADKSVRFDIICDIVKSDMASYLKEEAIRIVCGIEKEEK